MNGMDRHKKDVLEMFGENIHDAEDFVAVPLQPAVSRRAVAEEDVDTASNSILERNAGASEANEATLSEGSDDNCRCQCLRPPRRIIPKLLKRMKGRRNLSKDESKSK